MAFSNKDFDQLGKIFVKAFAQQAKMQKKILEQEEKQSSLFGYKGMGHPLSVGSLKYELSRASWASNAPIQKAMESWSKNIGFQARGLAFGQNLGDLRGKSPFGGKAGKLAGGLGGFNQQLESELGLKEVGFRKISDSMRNLSVSMRLTGQDEKKLHYILRNSNVIGNVSNAETAKLAETIAESSRVYGTQADEMVGALDSLRGSLLDFGTLGIAGPMEEAVTDLVAKYGAGQKDLITSFITQLTSREAFDIFARQGLTKELNDVLTATSKDSAAKSIEDLWKKSGEIAKNQKDLLMGDKSHSNISLGVFKNMYGVLGQTAISLSKQEVLSKKSLADQNGADQTWEAQWGSFYSDISKWMSFGYETTQDGLVLANKGVALLQGISTLLTIEAGFKGVGRVLKGTQFIKGLFSAGAKVAGTAAGAEIAAGGLGGEALMATLPPVAIGAAVIGAGYLGYKYINRERDAQHDAFEKLMLQTAPIRRTSMAELTNGGVSSSETFNNNNMTEDMLNNLINVNKKSNDLHQETVQQLKKMNASTLNARDARLGR